MNIVIDSQAYKDDSNFRGVGAYTKLLIHNLTHYDKENKYYLSSNLVKSTKIDLYFIPYFFPYRLSLPIIKKYQTIITIHDLIPLKFPKHFPAGLKGKLIWSLQMRLIQSVDHIITDSTVSYNDILSICRINPGKLSIVHPAIDSQFKVISNKDNLLTAIKKFHLPDQFVLYIGDANWNKNIPILIKACQKLNLNLVLVGKVFTRKNFDLAHPWNKSLKSILDLCENNPFVKRLGFVETSDLVALLNLATVYVQPSIYEGFGLPVVEAFACGCPVIVSTGGSLSEVGGDAVLYFDPNDFNKLVNNLKLIFSKKSLRLSLRSKGLLRSRVFSAESFYRNIIKVYEKISVS